MILVTDFLKFGINISIKNMHIYSGPIKLFSAEARTQ